MYFINKGYRRRWVNYLHHSDINRTEAQTELNCSRPPIILDAISIDMFWISPEVI